jgi:hypothetical protein
MSSNEKGEGKIVKVKSLERGVIENYRLMGCEAMYSG